MLLADFFLRRWGCQPPHLSLQACKSLFSEWSRFTSYWELRMLTEFMVHKLIIFQLLAEMCCIFWGICNRLIATAAAINSALCSHLFINVGVYGGLKLFGSTSPGFRVLCFISQFHINLVHKISMGFGNWYSLMTFNDPFN